MIWYCGHNLHDEKTQVYKSWTDIAIDSYFTHREEGSPSDPHGHLTPPHYGTVAWRGLSIYLMERIKKRNKISD